MTPISPTQLLPFSASNAPEEKYRLQKTTTLIYKDERDEEEITVPNFPDINALAEEEQSQALAMHLKSVVGAFLHETRTGREDFTLHGSTAIAINLLSQLSADTIRKYELECGTPPECYLPLFENEQSNLDFVCKKTEPEIESIVRLLEGALEGCDNKLKIETYESPIELNSILGDPSAYRKDMKQVFLITGYTQRIMAKYEGKTILSLYITYPPKKQLSGEFKYNRPYCKESKITPVKFGESSVEINVNSLEQSIHDIYSNINSKTHRSSEEKKPFYWIKLITQLSMKKGLSGENRRNVLSVIISFSKNQGEKLVKSSCQQTQDKKTKKSEANTEIESKAERQNRLVKTTVVKQVGKASMIDAPPEVSSSVETDLSYPCDPDSLSLKTFSDMAVQTVVQNRVEMPPSTRNKATLKEHDSHENKVRNPKDVAEEIKNIFNIKMQFYGHKKFFYRRVKSFCDFDKLNELYKELISVVTLEKCHCVFGSQEYEYIFIQSLRKILVKLEDVKSCLKYLNREQKYEIKALLSLEFIKISGVIREGKMFDVRRNACGSSLQIRMQYVDAEYCVMMHGCIDWIKEGGMGEDRALAKHLSCYFRLFMDLYKNNFLLRQNLPCGLNVIMGVFYVLNGMPFVDMFLLHMELFVTGEKYREAQEKSGCVPSVDDIAAVLEGICEPVTYCVKLPRLFSMLYEKNCFFYAGVIMRYHMSLMISSSEYRQECHKTDFFQISTSRTVFNIFDGLMKFELGAVQDLTERSSIINRERSRILQGELKKESNKLLEVSLSESCSIFNRIEIEEFFDLFLIV